MISVVNKELTISDKRISTVVGLHTDKCSYGKIQLGTRQTCLKVLNLKSILGCSGLAKAMRLGGKIGDMEDFDRSAGHDPCS